MSLYSTFRPLMFALDAERAHRLTIRALKLTRPGLPAPTDKLLTINVAGRDFPNPIGLAAGFDKDAEVFAHMLGLGFGFAEVGTLTPRPQAGNPKPRLFRLADDEAVINRMGFNNGGLDAARVRLANGRRVWTGTRFKLSARRPGIVGVNIGANKDSDDRIADYVAGVREMGRSEASYLTVNISSPNTPGLRALQDEGALRELLAAIAEARPLLYDEYRVPVFLKVAPDLERAEIDAIVRATIDHGLDALIVANTTISRPPLRSRYAGEAGGLSGAPLRALALQRLRDFRTVAGADLPLIAAGGIASGADAWARIKAGASLVQLYSALVYEGPGLARRINRELRALVEQEGFATLADAVGSTA